MMGRGGRDLLFAGILVLGIIKPAVPSHAQSIDSKLSGQTLGALRKACIDVGIGNLIEQAVLRRAGRVPNIGFIPFQNAKPLSAITVGSGMTFRWFCPNYGNGSYRVTWLTAERPHV